MVNRTKTAVGKKKAPKKKPAKTSKKKVAKSVTKKPPIVNGRHFIEIGDDTLRHWDLGSENRAKQLAALNQLAASADGVDGVFLALSKVHRSCQDEERQRARDLLEPLVLFADQTEIATVFRRGHISASLVVALGEPGLEMLLEGMKDSSVKRRHECALALVDYVKLHGHSHRLRKAVGITWNRRTPELEINEPSRAVQRVLREAGKIAEEAEQVAILDRKAANGEGE